MPVDAPTRDLPADLDDQAKAFVSSLDQIYTLASDPELFGQYIRSIMTELQTNPQYTKLICDDDVATMIRGMRESMGLARIKKEVNKTKRTSGSTSTKKSNPKADGMMDELAALAAQMGGLD